MKLVKLSIHSTGGK